MGNNRKRLVGRVVSDKMDKTVSVEIERRITHRIYKKVVNVTRKVLAHDETNAVPVGALVQIVESRPLSKRKRWAVETVLDTPDTVTSAEILVASESEVAEAAEEAEAEAEIEVEADEPEEEEEA
jgi:small subunit ribosomal protein S17